jgi:carbonic anhydrase
VKTKSIWIWYFCVAFAAVASAQPASVHIDGREALDRLRAGNQRYLAGQFDLVRIGKAARARVAESQQPFATVLTCSDSRVPPEIIFSQGLGDVFVVRVAGAVPDQAVLGSIEYAAEHLHVPLVVIMGHLACGAVKSAMESPPPAKPDPAQANIERILSAIRPSLSHAQPQGDKWANAVHASVDQNIDDAIRLSPVLAESVTSGKVMLVGAVYDLGSGRVDFSKPVERAAGRGKSH